MILRALEIGGEGYGPDDVLHEIREGRARVFSSDRASMVVETDGHTAHIWLAGGRLRDVLDLHLEVERWARANGYRELTIEGRKGWERFAPRYGFEVCGTMLRKALAR